MYRLLRSVAVGAGAAAAVGGALYIVQEQQERSRSKLAITMSNEWNFSTKQKITQAAQAAAGPDKARYLDDALRTLVTPNTDLRTKSADWLAGYADLLRALGIAYASYAPEQSVAPLQAARSIPLGNPALRAEAQVALYEATDDPQFLGDEVSAPAALESVEDIRAWAPLLFVRAQLAISTQPKQALNELLVLHQKIAAPANDVLCFKAKASGFIAQLLWRLGHKTDAAAWLKAGAQDAQCGTPACRETREMLADLQARTSK